MNKEEFHYFVPNFYFQAHGNAGVRGRKDQFSLWVDEGGVGWRSGKEEKVGDILGIQLKEKLNKLLWHRDIDGAIELIQKTIKRPGYLKEQHEKTIKALKNLKPRLVTLS